MPVAALTSQLGLRHLGRLPGDLGVGHLRDLVAGGTDRGGTWRCADLVAVPDLLARRELVALARLVGGRGPGLTPAGDDFLAAVLVIDALRYPDEPAARRAAAEVVSTTDVAAAFLRWAARGQCIQPFHDVVTAIANAQSAREAEARADVLATGASSGRALLLGLDMALSAA